MKILLYSDLHLREDRLDDAIFVLNEVRDIAVSRGIKKLINGGDTFNTRGVIRTRCLRALYDAYAIYASTGLEQTILVGNHDQEDRAGLIHPMKIFEQFKGWFVADEPRTIGGIAFIPYVEPKKVEAFLSRVKPITARTGVAVVHLGIKGAMINDWRADTEGIPAKWFSKFKRVFSGHYHYRNAFDNVQYIGSPYQQTHAEAGQEKGVLIYDTISGVIEFVEIKGTPKHYDIKTYWEDGKQKWEKSKDITDKDFVRVMAVGEAEQVSKLNQAVLHKKFKCAGLKIHRDVVAKSVSRMNIGANEIYDKPGLMKKYVEFVDTELDRKKIIKVGEDIINATL